MRPVVTVIGGGFAGVEAAWAAAERGCDVALHEMRPATATAVHRTGDLAEIVCSNSFKSALLTNASGAMKEEMRLLGSVTLPAADRCRVPAGEALAVDREPFAQEVTAAVAAHPHIRVVRGEVTAIPTDRPLIVATGPLTSDAFAAAIRDLTGAAALHFFDAVAPTVTLESLDPTRMFRASRRGKSSDPAAAAGEEGEEGDYLNCPLSRDQFEAFHAALLTAELAPVHNPDDAAARFFEMCLPVEELARRGPRTLAFGPMKPIGLTDPRTGRRAWAVVQLRQENRSGSLWGLVGFQTRLKWGEQQRVFRMIPGLENAEFVRYGVMHRNTYLNAPLLLDLNAQLRTHPGVFFAGQITGVEGYMESAAIGIVAGIAAARMAHGMPAPAMPGDTVIGSLCRYLVETDPRRFAPMNANFGIVPELDAPCRDKREKARRKSDRALAAMAAFARTAAGVPPTP